MVTLAIAQAPDYSLVELPGQSTYFSKTYYNAKDKFYLTEISGSS